MNFMNLYALNEVKSEDRDILISSEDLLMKFLNFIEFWKEFNSDQELIIFTIEILMFYFFLMTMNFFIFF